MYLYLSQQVKLNSLPGTNPHDQAFKSGVQTEVRLILTFSGAKQIKYFTPPQGAAPVVLDGLLAPDKEKLSSGSDD